MKRVGAVVEIIVVVGVLGVVRVLLRGTDFSAWQDAVFGGASLTGAVLFFGLPSIALLAGGRNLGRYGLTTRDVGTHAVVALKALSVLLPATMLFPLVGVLGTTPMEWLGATVLTVGFAVAGCLVIRLVKNVLELPARDITRTALLGYLGVLLAGLTLGFLANLQSDRLARVVYVLLFVGFLEEFFFRGYVQSRLNDYFGRPCVVLGARVGPGLVLAAFVFGLLHPLMSPEGTPWPWAMWTAVMGMVLGFLREKTGAVVAPAAAHGIILLPQVFFAG